MMRCLLELVRNLPQHSIIGPKDAIITGLSYDSRSVESGHIFFALTGLHSDGHTYIDKALDAGAAAIVHSRELPFYRPDIAYVRVPDTRFAMSPVADAFYGQPSRSMAVIGVTGTEGKSTTVYLIYQLLRLLNLRVGFFSTVMSDSGRGELPNPEHQTTPEATAVHSMLASMRNAGYEYAVVESSSHGLSPRTNRLGDVAFDVGVMTNVTSEHLEFHGSVEQYRNDKANLFRALDRYDHEKTIAGRTVEVPSFGVVNEDDPVSVLFREVCGKHVYSFGIDNPSADANAHNVASDAHGVSFTYSEAGQDWPARIELPGAFNVGNVLAALLVVSRLRKVSASELLPLLPQLKPVRGRMSIVNKGQPFEVLVDYAHTPSSFQAILPPLRERVKGKMICVFGSGGERDTEKRPQQGRVAANYCDIVILTDEDPRGEDPLVILEDMASGCPERKRDQDLFLIPDRKKAIRKAYALAKPGDLVLLLGKGHENSIIYARETIPYDEITEAETALAELGYERSFA
jgi:UDP-N-acetylmuramoyl-L-alanyl-D-glutamate--2,6-diaminopimelate ligase